MYATRLLFVGAAVALTGAVGFPAGVAIGLVGAAVVAPKGYPPFDPRAAEGRALLFVPAARSGVEDRPAPVRPTQALGAARARLLEVHSAFLQRERQASAILDRYRPTVTRPGRRATPALLRVLTRTLRAHEKARRNLAGVVAPAPLADAHNATLRMLEAAADAYREVIAAGRKRDPKFALARDAGHTRALAEHFVALGALRPVPPTGARAGMAPADS